MPKLDPYFLRSKASSTEIVKSSFTLTPRAAKMLDALSVQANVSAREIFDQVRNEWFDQGSWLEQIAVRFKASDRIDDRSIRKTLALSRRGLDELEKKAKESQLKRDDLACAVIEQTLISFNEQVAEAKRIWEIIETFHSSMIDAIRDAGRIRVTEIALGCGVNRKYFGMNAPDPAEEELGEDVAKNIPMRLLLSILSMERRMLDLGVEEDWWSLLYEEDRFEGMMCDGLDENDKREIEGRLRIREIRDIARNLKPIIIEEDPK